MTKSKAKSEWTPEKIASDMRQIICDQLGVDLEELTPDASFRDDLGADSLDDVEVIMALEEHFNLEISDVDAEKLLTIRHAQNYLVRRLNA